MRVSSASRARTAKPRKKIGQDPVRRAQLVLLLLWVVANFFSELLQEISFYFETMFAVAQWLVLRLCFPKIGYWILVSIWGWILAVITVFYFEFDSLISPHIPGINVPVMGLALTWQEYGTAISVKSFVWLVIGLLQWLLLRCYLEKAFWWIPASTFGATLKGALESIFTTLDLSTVGVLIGACGYATMTGLVLIWLLKENLNAYSLSS